MSIASNQKVLEDQLAELQKEIANLNAGKKVSSGRARKAAMEMIKAAKALRIAVNEKKKTMGGGAKKPSKKKGSKK